MRIALVTALALVACVTAGTAQAHYGNIWFDTAGHTAKYIQEYYDVYDAKCSPVPGPVRARYSVHKYYDRSTDTVKWDHLLCGIESEITERTCLVIAHITGKYSANFYLTSYYVKGCSPTDIRRSS